MAAVQDSLLFQIIISNNITYQGKEIIVENGLSPVISFAFAGVFLFIVLIFIKLCTSHVDDVNEETDFCEWITIEAKNPISSSPNNITNDCKTNSYVFKKWACQQHLRTINQL